MKVKVTWSTRGRLYLDVPDGADDEQVVAAFYKHIEDGGSDISNGGSCDGYEFDGYESEDGSCEVCTDACPIRSTCDKG